MIIVPTWDRYGVFRERDKAGHFAGKLGIEGANKERFPTCAACNKKPICADDSD